MRIHLMLFSAMGMLAAASGATAQQVTVATPSHNLNDGFYERQGIGFGFSIPGGGVPNGRNSGVFGLGANGAIQPNVNFNQGGFNNAIPPFGGFDPNATARGGAAVLNKNGNMFFDFEFGQGSTRSNVSETPMLTLTNGVPGNFTSVVQRPFVTSVTPVVNEWTGQPRHNIFVPQYQARQPARRPSGPPAVVDMVNRLRDEGGFTPAKPFADNEPGVAAAEAVLHPADEVAAASASSAGRHAPSIAEIQARQAAEAEQVDREALALYERGLAAEAEGKQSLARNYFRIAAGQADGELKALATEKMRQLQTTGSAGSRR